MYSFRVGRLFNIDLRVDTSWLFIFLLMTWNLLIVVSRWHPTWIPLAHLGVAIAASLAFFACILLHELAHTFAAKRCGLRVGSVTLFLFGGVSNIEQEPKSPRVEFITAAAGPLVSLLLGTGILLVAALLWGADGVDTRGAWNALPHLGLFASLVVWLGSVNLMIGVFNLIPGFPLDGGRILRSFLWRVTGDLSLSTRWASRLGQVVGWGFIGTGIAMSFGAEVPLFGTGFVGGLWLAFIGWFIHSAAYRTHTRLAIDEVLSGHSVAELMRHHGSTVAPGLSLAALVHERFVHSDERALPVVLDGKLLGLVAMSDVHTVAPSEWPTTPVSRVMRPVQGLTVTTPGEPLLSAFEQLTRQNVGQLPVLSGGRLVGMLQRRDVARWLELVWRPATGQGARAGVSSSPSHAQPATPGGGGPLQSRAT